DTPRDFSSVPSGRVTVAGVAWSQHVGVSRVEVRVDDGSWADAVLAEAISADTWVQWSYSWDASPGRHRGNVRATDANGQAQTAARADGVPDGATGHHSVLIDVS